MPPPPLDLPLRLPPLSLQAHMPHPPTPSLTAHVQHELTTCVDIGRAASLLAYAASAHKSTVSPPPASAGHPLTPIFQEYASNGFPVEVGPEGYLTTIRKAIAKGLHTPTLTATATALCQTKILKRSLWGFSIILTVEDAIRLFITLLRISRLALVEQQNRKTRLIYNSSEAPEIVTPAVNASSEKSSDSKAMQFGPCLERRLQRFWEEDPKEDPVWLSNWYSSDDFHWCNLLLSDVGKLDYVVPPRSF